MKSTKKQVPGEWTIHDSWAGCREHWKIL